MDPLKVTTMMRTILSFLLLASVSMAASVEHPGRLVLSPDPDALAITPRLYGVHGAGMEMSVYYHALRSGQSPRVWQAWIDAYRGKVQDTRWTYTPTEDVTAETLTIEALEPDGLAVMGTGDYQLDVVSNTAASGATMRVLVIGDSTTSSSGGQWIDRALALSSANASAVQPTYMGTVGGGSNWHEARSGWSLDRYFQPDETYRTTNPFVELEGGKFDASYYLTNTAQSAPDVVIWMIGINDVFALDSEASAASAVTAFTTQLDKCIGIVEDAAVGSWSEVGAGIEHLICLPTAPIEDLDGWASQYGPQYRRHRYLRNLAHLWHGLIDHYGSLEGSGIFLVPTNAAVDQTYGFPFVGSVSRSVHSTETYSQRNDALHQNESGQKQLGDLIWSALNVLYVRGLIAQ